MGEQVALLTHWGSTLTKASVPARRRSWGLCASTLKSSSCIGSYFHKIIPGSQEAESKVAAQMTQEGPQIDRLPNDADASDTVSRFQPPRWRRQPQNLERRHQLKAAKQARCQGRRAAPPYTPGGNFLGSRKSSAGVGFHLNQSGLDKPNQVAII